MLLSVIIPTLNEATELADTIRQTRARNGATPVEIIVSDCDSPDGTADVASRIEGIKISRGANSRADAMNHGAEMARGEVLLFLHADTLLPCNFAALISQTMNDPAIVGGAFDFHFAAEPGASAYTSLALDLVVAINRVRFRWTGNFYGDQAIFCRRNVFDASGGFPNVKLMEDIRFCQRMKRLGRTAILQPPAVTSPRRFVSCGVIRQFAHDLLLLGCESCGESSTALSGAYHRWNRNRHRIHDARSTFHPANEIPDPATTASPPLSKT